MILKSGFKTYHYTSPSLSKIAVPILEYNRGYH
jgi:hypothetical protein